MNIRKSLVASVVVASLAIGLPAIATELREPHAHMIVDVPNNWVADVEGKYARAYPTDHTFHLYLIGTEHGWKQEKEAEDHVAAFLVDHLKDVTVDNHGKRVDWNGYEGVEIFGHGFRRSDGEKAKFFALVLRDKKNPKKGVVALGIGTHAGFEKHQKGIYEALHTLRTW